MRYAMRVLLMSALIALTTQTALAVEKDCAEPACPVITIMGDKEATLPNGEPSPFRGFADATIRRDPESGRLWMAYSWPSVRVDKDKRRGLFRRQSGGSPQVEIHLAYSDDQGRNWRLEKTLWSPTSTRSPRGEEGYMSHEVANLLPVRENGRLVWYGARLDYFLPDNGGFRKRPPQSFRILIGRASSPGELAHAPTTALGSMATDPAWGMDVNLAQLSPDTRHCMLWNEPALFHDGKELFLALSCMAFRGKTPDMERNDLVVFATRPQGPPSRWLWRYAGKLAGAREAGELGGERLTQIDLARSRDGRLLAIVTPDTWDAAAHDFVHLGCVAVEVESADRSLRLARDATGRLKVAARVTASDAGPSGTAACTYDPASETGIILDKRIKIGAELGHARDGAKAQMYEELHSTGVHP
jgi:hypothetical protein